MPQYKKVFDIGTYTGNGGQYRVGIPTLRGVGPTGTQVAQSLRFRNSVPSYLTRTPGSTSNQKTWTWSAWTKLGKINSTAYLFTSGNTGSISTNYILFGYSTSGFANNTDTIQFICTAGNVGKLSFQSTAIYKDVSQWNHIMVAVDTTQATSTNRVKIYLNGVQVTSWATATYPSQNYDIDFWNTSSYPHYIGHIQTYGEYDGYMSEVYFVDGQQLTPSSFGEYNADGIWVPKAYSGTYGTNGFYLPMNSSSNYATDQSGNGNNFTPSGFNVTTANTTYDIMTDSPVDYLSGSMTTANNAGNYCVMNPVDSSTAPNSGNLNVSHPQNDYGTFSSYFLKSGRYWAECTVVTGPYLDIGICKSQYIATSGYANAYLYQGNNGYKAVLGTATAYGSTYTTGDVIGIDLDIDGGTVTFYKQTSGSGSFVSQGSISIASNSDGYKFYSLNAASNQGTMAVAWNFGQRAFNNTSIPSGAKAVNTYNYPRPADSALWFYGDTPDLMWIKNRSTTGLHTITDTVRGAGLNLVTSSSAAETSYPAVSEMNKFGMSVINDGTSIVNGSGNSMVYWGWKAGSNTSSTSVTNNDGAVTSQVSVNKLSGFSIVTGTTVSTGGSTFGHGLGVTPDLMIVKIRSAGSTNWHVYHSSLGYLKYLLLNSTASVTTEVTPTTWGTSPTSSAFTLGGNWQGGYNIVAYLWDAIPGYSAFGTYTGNGSSDGPFIYTGFRPRFILAKLYDQASGNWVILDTTRDTYNPIDKGLYTNVTNSEATTLYVDATANGFKIRHSSTNMNTSGYNYIYAAFAEIPFKFARSR